MDPTDDKYVRKNVRSDLGGSRKRYASKLLPAGHVGGLFADDYTQKLLKEDTEWPGSLPLPKVKCALPGAYLKSANVYLRKGSQTLLKPETIHKTHNNFSPETLKRRAIIIPAN